MVNYHINPTTGTVGACRAREGRCPFGGEHFPSRQEGLKAYEASQGDSFKPLDVADDKAIAALRGDTYRMNHTAPVKDGDDFNKPLHRLTEIFPPDVYKHPDWYGLQHDETRRQLLIARGNPEALVTIYRGVPKGVRSIHPGDWVALSYEYALGESYGTGRDGSDGDVISAQVPAKTLYTDANSLEEWGFSGDRTLAGGLKK